MRAAGRNLSNFAHTHTRAAKLVVEIYQNSNGAMHLDATVN